MMMFYSDTQFAAATDDGCGISNHSITQLDKPSMFLLQIVRRAQPSASIALQLAPFCHCAAADCISISLRGPSERSTDAQ